MTRALLTVALGQFVLASGENVCSGDTCPPASESAVEDDLASLLVLKRKAEVAGASRVNTSTGNSQREMSSTGGWLPIDFVWWRPLPGSMPSPRFAVKVAPSGEPPQSLLLDTGSSVLAFCDKGLAEREKEHRVGGALSCSTYGTGLSGYWGYFYKGPLDANGSPALASGVYSIMEESQHMPCSGGLQGIFGIGGTRMSRARDTSFIPHFDQTLQCPPYLSTNPAPPLYEWLATNTRDQPLVGIEWSGRDTEGAGTLYLGPDALLNEHYTRAPAQSALLENSNYYRVLIQKYTWNGQDVELPVNCAKGATPCFLDTGGTSFPISPEMARQCQRMKLVPTSEWTPESRTFTMTMSGPYAGSPPVVLEIDLEALCLMDLYQVWQPTSNHLNYGFPFWAFYYTVFDLAGKSAQFAIHPPEQIEGLKAWLRSKGQTR